MEQNSVPSVTLNDLVEQYCAARYNDKKKYFLNYLIHGRWIWKDIFLNTLWAVKKKYVKVDKTVTPYRVETPRHALRVLGVSVRDEKGHLHALTVEDRMDTDCIPNPAVCPDCGQVDTLNACANEFSLTTKTVTINGVDYTEKTWKESCPNGEVVQIREVPTEDVAADGTVTIRTVTQRTVLAKVEVNPCGCIADTDQNRDKLTWCGCQLLPASAHTVQTHSEPYQKYGKIKIVNQTEVYLKGDVPDYVLLTWQTNGEEAATGIRIPEYAAEAVTFGIHWRSSALAPNAGRFDRRMNRMDYDREVEKLDGFLNPVRLEQFTSGQMGIGLWGAAGDGLPCSEPLTFTNP